MADAGAPAMKYEPLDHVRLAVWLARDAAPTFAVLRRSAAEIDRLVRARLISTIRWASVTRLGAQRFEAGGVNPDDLLGPEPFSALRALKPISKADIRAAGTGAFAGDRQHPAWRSSHSSGSTGEPFRVFYDTRAWATLKHLVKLRARTACGVRPLDRVALLDAIPPENESRTILERAGRTARISVLQPAHRIAERLLAFRPDVVYGLPSALLEAGRELGSAKERLTVRTVFTSGELLDGATRRGLRHAFGGDVLNVYGTSETKEMGWECHAGGMHINLDVVLVEILDQDGNAVPEGAEGEIVVTLLVNRAMPLVRYRTGDRGTVMGDDCPCGIPLPRLGVVAGREADVLEFADGRRVSPYMITCALEAVRGVLRYQVSQLAPDRLRVRTRIDGPLKRAQLEDNIRRALRQAIGESVAVDIELVDHFGTGPRAKFRVVQPLTRV